MKYVKGTAANNFWLDQWDTTPDANLPSSVCSSSGLSGQIWEALQSSQSSFIHYNIVIFKWVSIQRWQCSIYNDTNDKFLDFAIFARRVD